MPKRIAKNEWGIKAEATFSDKNGGRWRFNPFLLQANGFGKTPVKT